MPSSPIPSGKRPDFKHSRSVGWSWPRLVPINEQASRLPQASQSSLVTSSREHSEQEEPAVSNMISDLDPEEEAPYSPVNSAAGGHRPTEEPVAESLYQPPNEHPRDSRSSGVDIDEKKEAAKQNSASSASSSVEILPEKRKANSERGYVEDVAGKMSSDSQRQAVGDIAESASPSERPLVGDKADQNGSEIPVGYESASVDPPIESDERSESTDQCIARKVTDAPLNEQTPKASPAKSISPVMDRISIPTNSVPYYATPKIMIHEPSQSSEAESPNSSSSDEVLANERQSLPQETISQPPHSIPDGELMDPPPMQSMALKPIAWQVSKGEKIKKRKLYLRKVRNAAVRKTILKLTLGRQLATPTKQMLRLLASGESLPDPNLLQQDVEASTVLVPQEAVGSVTGAVLLPHDAAGVV